MGLNEFDSGKEEIEQVNKQITGNTSYVMDYTGIAA